VHDVENDVSTVCFNFELDKGHICQMFQTLCSLTYFPKWLYLSYY